jgi:3-hydroxyacyl-CoA dehydrogenase
MTDAMHPPVSWQADGDVLVVTIDNPPVNALGHRVREGLVRAADTLDTDPSLRAMVIGTTGTIFIGGADIREFGGPRLDPMLNAVCDRLEQCRKPVVAAMQGAALGGGFEVALAAHVRVAAPAAVVAFPEVLLGLLPGAGGTQRAPRLCGAVLALDLMLSGRRLAATDALAAGLVDVVTDDPVAHAMHLAHDAAFQVQAPRRSRDGTALRDSAAQRAAIHRVTAELPDDPTYRFARERIVACVTAAVERPYVEGATFEADAFLACLASPQREQLVQQFFAERAARKAAGATPRENDRR